MFKSKQWNDPAIPFGIFIELSHYYPAILEEMELSEFLNLVTRDVRETLILLIEGYTIKEIAEIQKLTISMVYRKRKKIRTSYEKYFTFRD